MMFNEKTFKRLWWISLFANVLILAGIGFVVLHFVRKYW